MFVAAEPGCRMGGKAWSDSHLSRWRWNVLDMVTVIASGAVPTYLFCEIDMSFAENLRQQLAAKGVHVTPTAILLKAIALAQRATPASRSAALPFGRMVTFNHIVAGFTVERTIDGQPCVFFGTIESPDTKPLAEIASELKAYAECSIDDLPQLRLEKYFAGMPWLLRQAIIWLSLRNPPLRLRFMGATFGLSSLGKYGMRAVTGPCVCTSTFGVGAIEERPVAASGEVVVHPVMTLSLSYDQRVIDGAPAARFLAEVKRLIEGGLVAALDPGASAQTIAGSDPGADGR